MQLTLRSFYCQQKKKDSQHTYSKDRKETGSVALGFYPMHHKYKLTIILNKQVGAKKISVTIQTEQR